MQKTQTLESACAQRHRRIFLTTQGEQKDGKTRSFLLLDRLLIKSSQNTVVFFIWAIYNVFMDTFTGTMKFKSKIDWWLHLIFICWLIANAWGIINAVGGGMGGLIIAITFTPFSVFLIVPIWLNTYYLLDESSLLIKSGLGRGERIEYGLIMKVGETRNPSSAKALSLDRLEIKFKAKSGAFNDSIIISPKDKQEFMTQLKLRNDSIEISREPMPMSKAVKISLIVAGVISALILAGVGIMFIWGEMEPEVIFQGDSLQIRAMYGITVDFSNISGVYLLSQSMREIGAGRRTNGYNGINVWRGHFTAGLLFVRPDISPTIRIERIRGSNIYLSFRESWRSLHLYNELKSLIN